MENFTKLRFQIDRCKTLRPTADFLAAENPLTSQFLISASVDPLSANGIGSLLFKGAVENARRNSIETICFGGRLTGMRTKVLNGSAPADVFSALIRGEIVGSSIQMGIKAGFEPVRFIENYFDDSESLNFGILMICSTIEKKRDFSESDDAQFVDSEGVFG